MTNKSYSIIFSSPTGNTKLLAQINDGLRKVYKNGTYAKVYHKWFGNTPVPKLPIK